MRPIRPSPVTYATFVPGDTPASLAGTLAFTTTATTASAVGDYDVTPSGLTSANYDITFVKGTLTVTKAPLTVTAHRARRSTVRPIRPSR